jgi:predicted nucleic acid-binding protein
VILADTSVWVDHLRRGNQALARLLDDGNVCCHEFVIGELACGNLRRRTEVLHLLAQLPRSPTARHDEVIELVERRRLHGAGLGWVDAHLLTSAVVEGHYLWTLDKPLVAAAERMSIGVTAADI